MPENDLKLPSRSYWDGFKARNASLIDKVAYSGNNFTELIGLAPMIRYITGDPNTTSTEAIIAPIAGTANVVGKGVQKAAPVVKEAAELAVEQVVKLTNHLQGDEAVAMFKLYGGQEPVELIRLYRATGTNGNPIPSADGTAEYTGMWFTNNPNKVRLYASSTAKQARKLGQENPIELQYIDIPKDKAETFRATNILDKTFKGEFEPEDFIIPLEYPRERVKWDGHTGNLLLDSKIPLPELPANQSINMQQLRAYVPEVRQRYGLVGNENITDEEIVAALYKHIQELGGNTAAINAHGEPLLLFRGTTSRHEQLIPKGTSELSMSGADNILGNLFLGQMPHTVPGGDHGVARYLGLMQGWLGPIGPQTKAASVILPESQIATKDMYTLYTSKKFGDIQKLPGYAMNTGYNDINAYIVRTPNVRDASEEIVVLNPFETIPKHKRLGNNHSEHYRALVADAERQNQGLIHSKPVMVEHPYTKESIGKYRDEHEYYDYFALPNFNIHNAKHILPYDLRIPRNWGDLNVYKKSGGTIHIKKKNKGKFAKVRDYVDYKNKYK